MSSVTYPIFSLDVYPDGIFLNQYTNDGDAICRHPVALPDLATLFNDQPITTGLLPRHVLFVEKRGGGERVGIFVEGQVRQVWVDGRELTIPLPSSVFIGHKKVYRVFAVKGGVDFPDSDTTLYHFPVPNETNGKICRGNADFPIASAGTIWEAWETFISSHFNSHSSGKKTKSHDSVIEALNALHKAGATTFPNDELMSTYKTLGSKVKDYE